MSGHLKHLSWTTLIGAFVLMAGWSVHADEADDRSSAPPAENSDDGAAVEDANATEDESSDQRRAWRRGRDGSEDEARRRPRGEPGFRGEGRGGRGWRRSEADEDQTLPPLTEDEIEALMEQVEENMPELHEKMTLLREKNPEQFKRMAERVRGIVNDMNHPGRGRSRPAPPYEFFRVMGRLAYEYRKTDSEERRAEIKSQMRSKLQEHIERRQEHLREEISRMEERLEEMKAKLAEFEARKDECIDEHLEEILSGKRFGPPGRGPRDRSMPRGEHRRGDPPSRPAEGGRMRPHRPDPPRDSR